MGSMIIDTSWLMKKVASDIREGAILGALAYNAVHGKVEDDISELQAYKKYGKAWIKHHVEKGELHFTRIGKTDKSTKLYSVFEIETLKRAEKMIQKEFDRAMQNQNTKNNAQKT